MGLAFGPKGRLVPTLGLLDARVWDIPNRRVLAELKPHPSARVLYSAAFSPDAAILAIGSGSDVLLWETTNWKQIATLEGHGHSVWDLAFSPDGRFLGSGSLDGTALLWKVAEFEMDSEKK